MVGARTLRGGSSRTAEIVVVLAWPGVESLVETALQHLHDAVCVGMIMDG